MTEAQSTALVPRSAEEGVSQSHPVEEVGSQKRVPIVLPVAESELMGMTPAAFDELEQQLALERRRLKESGHISPRREAGSEPVPLSLLYSKALLNPRVEGASDAERSKREGTKLPLGFPTLRILFEAMGEAQETVTLHPWLVFLHAAALENDPRILWEPETPLQRRIKERVALAEAEERDRASRQREMLASQRAQLSPDAVFLANYHATLADLHRGADQDQATLHDIDKAVARIAQKKQQEERRRQEVATVVEQHREQRMLRSATRRKQVESLMVAEEDARDHVLAAMRVRARFEKAKSDYLTTGDLARLENY